MALVHIIAAHPEEARQLETDLRARGLDVLITAPGEWPSQPADFEITVQEYSAEEALRAAAAMAASEEIAVLIAPGAIVDAPAPMVVIPVTPEPQTLALPPQPILAVDQPAIPELAADTPEAVTQLELVPDSPVGIEVLASIHEVAHTAEPVITDAPTTAEQVQVAEEALEPAEIEAVSPAIYSTPQEAVPELEAIRAELEAVVPEIDPALAGANADVAVGGELFAATEEVDEPISDWPIWHPVLTGDNESAAEFPGPEPALEPEMVVSSVNDGSRVSVPITAYQVVRSRVYGNERVFWRTATVLAVVAVAALVVGGSYHRVSPLPAAVIGSPAPVEPAPISLPVRMPDVHRQMKSAPARVAEPPLLKSAAARQREPIPRAATKKGEPDIVAPDTVVRYSKRPAPSAPPKRVISSTHHATETEVVAEDTVRHFDKLPAVSPSRPQK